MIEVITEPQYRQALLHKLVEEAQEAAQASITFSSFSQFAAFANCSYQKSQRYQTTGS
jgi:hypothetical protein